MKNSTNNPALVRIPQRLAKTLVAGAALAALTGCVTGPSKLDQKKITEVDKESTELMAVRLKEESEKMVALQEQLYRQLEASKPLDIKPATPQVNPLDAVNVSLRVEDTDVRFVFRAIAEQAKLNLVLPASLSEKPRTITLALRNMPASQVFDHVLRTLDLHGEVDREVMVISDYQERIFNLDFLQTSISASFSAGGDVFGANQTGAGSSGASSGDSSQTGIRNGFNIRGRNTNDVDPFQQIEGLLKTVIYNEGDTGARKDTDKSASPMNDPRGPRYVLNKSTGTLYVKGRPSQIHTISKQVESFKAVMGRQVLIEAQILDIELNDDFQYGVDWTRLRQNAVAAFGSSALSLGAITTQLPNPGTADRSLTIPARNLGTSGTPNLGLTFGNANQSVAINMLKTFGTVHVLSNPSLRVKNTQPAVVSVGRNERYIAQTTSNISNAGGGQSTVSSNVITGNLFDGVMLGVIPFINDDGVINLTINPVQTTIQPGSNALINVGTEANPQRVSLPKVDFKGITTSLSLRNGDMVILGGLIGENGARSKAGLPGVAEVPVVGEALGNINRSSRSRELVVVLRVRTI